MGSQGISMPLEAPFWRDFSPLQLVVWAGIHARAIARMERRHAHGLYESDPAEFIADLYHEQRQISETLAAKLWADEEDPQYIDGVADVMGHWSAFTKRLQSQKDT